MERVDKEVDEIQMSFNAQNLLNRMGQSFTHIVPIRDELLHTDDGSEHEVDEEMLLDVLNFRTEDERINDMLVNVQKRVEEVKENVERSMSEDEYSMTAKPQEVAKMAIAAGDNLAPVREEIISVNDGEDTAEKIIDEFEFDEDTETVIEDDFGDLGGLIATITTELEEAEAQEADVDIATA